MIKNKLMLMLCAIGITFSMATKVLASNSTQRIWGSDRYATAIEVSKSGWADGSEYAILANGENFPDALSATPLAKKYNAPILLNSGATLDSRVEDELKRLGVKQVFIIGGSAVVPDTVKNKIEKLNIKTTRLWGQDRYETSIKVAEQLDFNGQVAVANGEGFADALSISPIAAQKSMPVILTPSNTLPDVVAEYIKSNKITKSYIIGENDVVSDKIANSFPNNERIWGNSKYDTNIAVLNRFKNELNLNKIYMANGENFPDALAGSALAAKNSTCVLLVSDYIGLATKKFSFDKLPTVKDTEILGGNAVVPDSLVNKVLYPDEDEVMNLHLGNSGVRQGNWIYYVISGRDTVSLFKSKTDGTSSIKLCDKERSIFNIAVAGDWIYFTASDSKDPIPTYLYKIKTDGTSETKLSDEPCSWFKIVDDKIYSSSSNSFTTMDLAGGNKINVPVNGMIVYPDVIDNYFYYIEQSSEENPQRKIYKMKNNGTDKVQISSEEPKDLKVYNNWLYFTTTNDGYHLKRMKLTGTEETSIVDVGSATTCSFDIYDDWIYYIGPDRNNLYKMKIDGSDNTKLLDSIGIDGVSVSNGWIYYYYNSGYNELGPEPKKVRIDGTDDRRW